MGDWTNLFFSHICSKASAKSHAPISSASWNFKNSFPPWPVMYTRILLRSSVNRRLLLGGDEVARSRLITDFFGNIQNVEVDRSKDSEFGDDMLELSKTIAFLRQKAEEEEAAEAAGNRTTSMPANVPTDAAKKVQGATALTDDSWWSKKVVGATALAGCAALWGLGSFLEG